MGNPSHPCQNPRRSTKVPGTFTKVVKILVFSITVREETP